uniref:Uncharacterized protein n=1 Tax=Oryza brachyantha TaxID=4533 RepID=J3LWN3_ORYBR
MAAKFLFKKIFGNRLTQCNNLNLIMIIFLLQKHGQCFIYHSTRSISIVRNSSYIRYEAYASLS